MELTPQQWERVKALFEIALEKAPSERGEFVAAATEDAEVRREVERLLAHHVESGGLLSSPVIPGGATPKSSGVLPSFAVGDLVAQRFRITGFIARGGMGEVYEAQDIELHERVALKSIRSELLHDGRVLERFKREVQLARKVTHPNICRTYDLFRHTGSTGRGGPGSVVLVAMELLEGETLGDFLQRRDRLTAEEARPIAVQMAAGLGAAHAAGVLHRDFKPGNVLLVPGRKGVRAVITDFGLALRSSQDLSLASSVTGAGEVLGTPAYMSPEQVEGKELTPASDVYSLGLVLYQMVTGARPFEDPSPLSMAVRRIQEEPLPPRKLAPDLDPQWESVILKCLARNPRDRFENGDEVARALQGEKTVPRARAGTWRILAATFAVVAALVAGGFYFRFHRSKVLTEKDTIVLADFDNHTGDPVFDGTLKTALTVALRQSPFLNVLSDGRVASTLKLMTRPPGTAITPELAREVCQRAGSAAYITGAIASLGSEYVLQLKAVNCRSGDTLAEEQATASAKEKILDALGRAASKLRVELGESLSTVQRFDLPLAEATTSSLEALQAFTLGRKALNEKGEAAALPYHERAIELDPNFAIAYRAVGADYFGMGQTGRASEYYTKAFQLREHASELEKLFITSTYYSAVTGELDKTAQTYEEEIQSYPHLPSYVGLGNVYIQEGEHEKAAQAYRESVRLFPESGVAYGNLALSLLALQRFDEARQIVQQAQARKLDDYVLRQALYALAFVAQDSSAMAEQQQWFLGKPEENNALSLESDTEAYFGRARKARELTKRAVDSAIRADSKETGAIWLENLALREAAFGNMAAAKQAAADGLKLAPGSSGAAAEAALAFAMAGVPERAQALAGDLDKHHPVDTQIQSLWLPAVRAQLALRGKHPSDAIDDLQASSKIELGLIPFAANISCLYPTYLRGEAYLEAGEGRFAISEFRKVIDHSGIVWNCWTGALAHLGLARANALVARSAQGAEADAARVRSLAAYEDFLTLWKDADPDIAILKQANAEYAGRR